MSESQSRYSIVERLTDKKLRLMKEKQTLKTSLAREEQELANKSKDFDDWKKDIKEDIKRQERNKQKELDKALKSFQNHEDNMKSEEASIDSQIETVDKALATIEEISKTSPTINK